MVGASIYRLEHLASGSYDVIWNGEPVAALVQVPNVGWWVEGLLDLQKMPAPFLKSRYQFPSFEAALKWLGDPTITKPCLS